MAKTAAEGIMPWVGTVAGGIVGSVFPVVGTGLGAAAGHAIGTQVGQSISTGQWPGINEAGPGGIPSLASMFTGGGGMGSPLGKGGGGSSSGGNVNISPGSFTDLGPLAVGLTQLGSEANTLGQLQTAQAQPLIGAGTGEFLAGATGQLTPAQQALSDFELGQADTRTNATFGNLGMGPGTGLTADLNANLLGNEAEKAQLEQMSQTAGLNALNVGRGFEAGGLSGVGTAGNMLLDAGSILHGTNSDYLKALQGAKGTAGNLLGSAGGSNSLLKMIGGLFGPSNPDMFANPFAGNTLDTFGTTAAGPLFSGSSLDLLGSGISGDASGAISSGFDTLLPEIAAAAA